MSRKPSLTQIDQSVLNALTGDKQTGRHGYLLELDPAYVDVTIRRWQARTGQKATNPALKASFDELEAQRSGSNIQEAGHDA